MANETIASSVNELASTAVAEARLVMRNRQDLRNLCVRRNLANGQENIRFPKYANLTAAAQSNEGQDQANQEWTTTGVVLTPAVNAMVTTRISDLAAHNSPQTMIDFGRAAGEAILKKINADIFALFDGFSTAVGSTGVDITNDTIRQAVTKLLQANAPEPYYFGFTPEVWQDWMAYLTTSGQGANVLSDEAKNKIVARVVDPSITIHGVVPVLITSGVSEAGDLKCGIWSQWALGYAEAWDIKVEPQRASKGVGTDFTASTAYAVGEIDDTMGVEVLVDGADA